MTNEQKPFWQNISFYVALFSLIGVMLGTFNPDVKTLFDNISPYLLQIIGLLLGVSATLVVQRLRQ